LRYPDGAVESVAERVGIIRDSGGEELVIYKIEPGCDSDVECWRVFRLDELGRLFIREDLGKITIVEVLDELPD
jgi:hypothetical protein